MITLSGVVRAGAVLATGGLALGEQVIVSQPPAPSPAIASGSGTTWLQDADDFSINAPTITETQSIRWWGGFFPGPPPESAAFRVRLYQSNGDATVPQTLLQAVNIPAVNISVAPTEYFSNSFGSKIPIFEFSAPISMSLDPELRYWINIARSDAGGFAWYEGVEGNGSHATMNPNPQFFLPWTSGATDRAFEIIAVPTPGVSALGAIGLSASLRRRRRRDRVR